MMENTTALSLVKVERENASTKNDRSSDKAYFQSIYDFLTFGQIPSGHTLESFRRMCVPYRVINGILHKGVRNPKKVVTDDREKEDIVAQFHIDEDSGIHKSAQDTSNAIHDHFFWRTILQDARHYTEKCGICQDSLSSHKTWTRLSLLVHGPFPTSSGELKSVVSLQDTASKWILAKVVATHESHFIPQVSSFLFSSMCQFGFTTCQCSIQENLFDSVAHNFSSLCESLRDETSMSIPQDLLHFAEVRDEDNVGESLAAFIGSHFETWDTESLLDIWLWKRRTQSSAFFAMFQREPNHMSEKNQRGEVHWAKKRRKLKSSMLACRHCGEAFTSRVSFKIHQQRHLDEARRAGVFHGEQERDPEDDEPSVSPEESPVKKRKIANNQHVEDDNSITVVTTTETTITAVKTLLNETQDERGKRGKYFKYSPELKEQIADYAQKFGSLEAADHFSRVLGNPLSESTIRNFVKAAQLFSQSLKEEIGKHAYQFGLEASLKLYRQKMPAGVELRRPMIKRLMDMFVAKNPNLPLEEDDEEAGEEVNQHRQKFIFEASLKNDIGRYAFHCGNTNAVHHFSNKLRFPMKESTIRKFKKIWMEKNGVDVMDTNKNDFVLDLGTTSNDPMSSYDITRDKVLEESQSAPLPLTVSRSNPAQDGQVEGVNPGPVKLKRRTIGTQKQGKKVEHQRRGKRGQYANYDPALRAEIAKFAMDHGNQETINYFREKLNIEVPESTVRGLRNRLLSKNFEATDQGKGRGRPMRLGKYDTTVQNCIRQLVASGEKPTSFLAVATAKQVLMENEPQLLVENGGNIELNTTWAKSFLRRMNLGK